ncbi:MAG: hypothetical protein KatS3mg131_2061 [Candidatus Tectimicrobiota bacterium]|nr:MAG: hypothetical protein KatS3mg131_2061 [Candidatus Tectomicrobia bacterium]
MAQPLKPGDLFPTFTFPTVQHGTLTVPADLSQRYTVLLVYRAHW